ncbi:efflux RND transporter periplasmic adaptor subunit [Luteimonas fraxinea]|uniref:Efflux RND transporter periplasmic adaptor subunit n=1 Tax=Luteimonas fraxinea TaxID=2901869 RepID=A0ABS8UBJ6_9GAMM|nr:efflux RND transporter periplasmic adaptor subunit [Luteimonas fraxinea]MCD9096352.1 efflux RND transporter periplasmic adaptor subunit [Luteimonas fraxinea]MCD9125695.1 efflux RND transporter periplasmic adaptor subunit [Luteimonas fraxinea]UHH10272.1 efflux RND transporter periplasmic adaptor subunit [Luteimonas fraxinea]
MRRLLSIAVLAAALSACGQQEEQAAPPPPEVGVLTVQPTSIALEQELVGRLAPFRSADVRARVPGVLESRVYQEGSDVSEGDVLFRIDPAQLQAALGTAQGSQAQAQANAINAKSAADRARQLAPTNFISKSDLDNALAAERSAEAALQAARASTQTAQINLGYATVRAPISGRAGKQQVTEGALVGQGDSTLLTTVDQIDPLYINFSMSAGEFARIRALPLDRDAGGGQVEIVLGDGTVHDQRATLDFSGDVVDPASGAIQLRATLPNPDRRLLPGVYVTLRANMGQQSGVFLVPQAAVLRDANTAYVLVAGEGDKVVRKSVRTDRAQGGQWVITDGLVAGDRVIVSGVPKARPDAVVSPKPWTPEQAQAQAAPGAAPAAQPAGEAAAPATPGDAAAAPTQEAAGQAPAANDTQD